MVPPTNGITFFFGEKNPECLPTLLTFGKLSLPPRGFPLRQLAYQAQRQPSLSGSRTAAPTLCTVSYRNKPQLRCVEREPHFGGSFLVCVTIEKELSFGRDSNSPLPWCSRQPSQGSHAQLLHSLTFPTIGGSHCRRIYSQV